jgi:flavodoxin I
MKINLIYGTETGFTKTIGEDILRQFIYDETKIIKVDEAAVEDWRADLVILGAPTWCEPRLDTFGEYSDDWNDSYDTFSKIDFTGQTVALYGLGDQIGYGNNFVDALGMMSKVVLANGGRLIGKKDPTEYDYEESEGVDEEGIFYGLPIDEDNEPTLTDLRVQVWAEQLKRELDV